MPYMRLIRPITNDTWLYICNDCYRYKYSTIKDRPYCYCRYKNKMRLARSNSI